MNKKYRKAIIGLLGVVFSAAIWADEKNNSTDISVGVTSKSSEKINALRVTTKPLSELVFATEYSAPASVVSLNDSSISAEIQARAVKVSVEVGDTIKRGKLLVTLDCRSYVTQKNRPLPH